MYRQITDTILMVRPAHFGFNRETAGNNAFQSNDTTLRPEEISTLARDEFDAMVEGLRAMGVNVIVVEDTSQPVKTDAVFPNNWFTTHSDGRLFLFPMYSKNRRLERREDIIDMLCSKYHYTVHQEILKYEQEDQFLEGTGSMILDRANHVLYACISERTHPELLQRYSQLLEYEVIDFKAVDDDDIPYYHTNVIMALGISLAFLCTESIVDIEDQDRVLQRLKDSNKTVIHVTRDQILAFAGNLLEVRGRDAKPLWIMSTSAYNILTKSQINIIEKTNVIFHTPLPIIEKYGGGSARCMMAEIFPPYIP